MSAHLAIRAEGLGKRYELGRAGTGYDSIRDYLVDGARYFFSKQRAKRSGVTELWALRDTTFEIAHGENVGIIGVKGASNSPSLIILSRITEPTTGRAEIDGRIGALLEVGTGFHLELTGRENVFLYGSILGMKREEVARKFDAIVDFAGIPQHIDTPVKRYSSGMYVRLAFAVAAHLEPEILFLDEVLAVGDLGFQRKCINFAKELQQRDATILFVSHNMFSIKTMCDRVIYMRQGRIQYDGPVDGGIEIYERDCRLGVLTRPGEAKPDDWPIFITACDVSDAAGGKKTIFDIGETMRIHLAYEVRKAVPHPNFMVSIVRSDGVTVCTYSTETDGVDLGPSPEDGELELELPPLRLVAEMYAIKITVREKGFGMVLCEQIGTTFHMRDPLLDINFGVYHEAAEWRVGPAVASAAALPGRLARVARLTSTGT